MFGPKEIRNEYFFSKLSQKGTFRRLYTDMGFYEATLITSQR